MLETQLHSLIDPIINHEFVLVIVDDR
eukprot:SAG31_NODE_43425_length_267_cov_0.619048_1_plen_26_part_01